MFKNLMVYRLQRPWDWSPDRLQDALERARYVPCAASQEKSAGWIEPRGVDHAGLVEVVAGQWVLKYQIEVKVLPASVVRRHADEKIAQIQATTGRKPGKKECRDLRDDARLALLPLAFTKMASVWVWVDPENSRVMLDCASQTRADEVVSALVQALDGQHGLALLDTRSSPATSMAAWLVEKEAPGDFSIAHECELKAADESRATVRYARHVLDTDEVAQHIQQGKLPTRLALSWADRVDFVLTEALQLRRIGIQDVVFEAAAGLSGDTREDDFDADVSIATAELQKLLQELIEALGGLTDAVQT